VCIVIMGLDVKLIINLRMDFSGDCGEYCYIMASSSEHMCYIKNYFLT
jgi:hypothetical protein